LSVIQTINGRSFYKERIQVYCRRLRLKFSRVLKVLLIKFENIKRIQLLGREQQQ